MANAIGTAIGVLILLLLTALSIAAVGFCFRIGWEMADEWLR